MKKSFFLIISICLASIIAQAQNSLEYVQTNDHATSRIRPNLYFDLPLGVKSYTFMEFYMEEDGSYYGETYLTKEVFSIFGVRADIWHTSFFKDVIGFGIHANLLSGGNTFLQVKYLPAYFEFKGWGRWKKTGVLGYFFSWDFTTGKLGKWQFWSFGDFNLHTQEWSYGEFYLDKYLGTHFALGLGGDLRASGKALPIINCGLKAKYTF